MKRMRAILCGILAALMLAGCGGVERVACQSERPSPDMNLTQYTVVEAAYPVFPKEPVYGDYIDDNGEGDWDAYFAAQEAYREELRQMGKGENVDDGAVLDFAGRTAAEIFAGQENTVYSPISLYVALGMLTELTDGETKRQVMALLDAADTETLRQQINRLWMSVYQDGDAVCRLANAAFLRENADVKQTAADTLAEWYFASSYRVPMGTEEADAAIASWLNQQTGGLLSEETGNIRTEEEIIRPVGGGPLRAVRRKRIPLPPPTAASSRWTSYTRRAREPTGRARATPPRPRRWNADGWCSYCRTRV